MTSAQQFKYYTGKIMETHYFHQQITTCQLIHNFKSKKYIQINNRSNRTPSSINSIPYDNNRNHKLQVTKTKKRKKNNNKNK